MRIWKNTKTLDALVPQIEAQAAPAGEADLAIIGSRKFDLDALPRLKTIFKCGVGTDNIPFEACAARGIEVVLPSQKTRDVIFEETANFAVYLILDRLYQQVGDWDSWTKYQRPLLRERKVLILGQGSIGKRVKDKLDPLLHVTTFDILENSEAELRPLIEAAEVISIHIPLSEATTGWFDREKLSWMQDGAALVNTARGPIVEEAALFQELSHQRLSAAFDVFWEEPYTGKLLEIDGQRFKRSPHVASTCSKFNESLADDLESLLGEN